jgi:hypothetical protein
MTMPFDLRRLFAFALPLLAACSSGPSADPTGSSAGSGGSTPVCSGGSGGSSSTGSPPHTSADLAGACQNLFDQQAAYTDACFYYFGPGPEQAAFVKLCLDVAGAPGSLVTAGDIDACANELGALQCVGWSEYPSCFGGSTLLFPGNDKAGAFPADVPCIAGLQCTSGHCRLTDGPCGVCRRGRTLGDTCSTPGDVCLDSSCVKGICGHQGTLPGGECFEYGGSSNCQQGLFCRSVHGFDGTGVCVPRAQACAGCQDTSECAQALSCEGGQCVPTRYLPNGASCGSGPRQCASECIDGVCRQRKLAQKEGEPCSVYDSCDVGLRCDGAVCTSQGFLAKGDVCSSKGAATGTCGAGLGCDSFCDFSFCDQGLCVDIPAAGDPCIALAECGPGAECIGFSVPNPGVCVKLGAANEACPCTANFMCSKGKCIDANPASCL